MKRLGPTICILLALVTTAVSQLPAVVVQSGHHNVVRSVAFSSDSMMLASGDTNGVVKLWDLSTNKEFRTIQSRIAVHALAFAPENKTLFIASEDGSVKRVDVLTGEVRAIIGRAPLAGIPTSVISNSARLVAQVLEDGTVRVSNLSDGKQVFRYDLPESEKEKVSLGIGPDGKQDFMYVGNGFVSLAFNPNGNLLAAATDKKLALIDTTTGAALGFAKAANAACLATSSDGLLVAVCEKGEATKAGKEKSWVTLRSGRNGKVLKTIDIQYGEAMSLAFTKDGKTLAGIVKVRNENEALDLFKIVHWNTLTGRPIRESEFEDYVSSFWSMTGLAFDPGGKTLAISAGDVSEGRIYLRDAASGIEVGQLKKLEGFLTDFRFLKGTLFYTGSRLFDLKTGKQSLTGFYSNKPITSDGKYILDGAEIKEIKTKKVLIKLDAPGLESLRGVARFSPDDRYVLAYGESKAQISLFDAKTGKRLFGIPDKPQLVCFSADSKLIAYSTLVDQKSGRHAVRIWNAEEKKQVGEINIVSPTLSNVLPFVTALGFDPSNNFIGVNRHSWDQNLNVNGIGSLNLYDVKTGAIRKQFGDQGRVESFAFSVDASLLAISSFENVKLLNVSDGSEERILSGHDASVTGVAFSPDGKFLASYNRYGQIIFWDVKTRTLASRILAIGDTDYLVVSPDNYYLASRKGAASAIAFRQGTRAFPFEQFDIRYNRPDLTLKALGTATSETIELYERAYQRRLRLNRLNGADLDSGLSVPEVSVDRSTVPAVTKEKLLRLKITARDDASTLSNLNIYVNDVSIYGSKGVPLDDTKIKTFAKEVDVELTSGRNRIQVSVTNAKQIESVRQTLNIQYDGPSPEPELYLIAIGASQYKDPAFNLTYPAKDVANVVGLFEKRTAEKETVYYLGGVPKDALGRDGNPKKSFYKMHKLEFTNENAVLEKIGAVRDFLAKAKPEDQVVFFIAGHGLLDRDRNYYFATYDIDFEHPERRGLSFAALVSFLDGTKARRKLLLLDTCHAGEIDQDVTSSAIPSSRLDSGVKQIAVRGVEVYEGQDGSVEDVASELFADLRLGNGTSVISASSGMGFAYESPKWSGGVFTYAISLALEQGLADSDHNGKISVSDLRAFVSKKVVELTDGRQRPDTRRESIEFDFRVY